MELTGLKHLKTTSFGKVVQANIQGNGSFQMLITCDCYSARQLTLFKGQVPWVCLCVRAHVHTGYMLSQNTKKLSHNKTCLITVSWINSDAHILNLFLLPSIELKAKQWAVDPSQPANPITLAFPAPAHLMTCWRLMSRAPKGHSRYLLCPQEVCMLQAETCPFQQPCLFGFKAENNLTCFPIYSTVN